MPASPEKITTKSPLPENTDELRTRIAEQQHQLSARLKQVAGWLLEHPQQVAFSTVAEIAEAAGVHPSTLIRFANFFGFSGFSELQRLYKHQVLEHPANYQQRIHQLKEVHGNNLQSTPATLLREFTEGNMLALELLRSQNYSDQLEAAVETLHQASEVYVAGMRRTYPVATYFYYTLNQLGIRCQLIDGTAGMQNEQLRWLDEQAVLIAITFSTYAESTCNAVRQAAEQGGKILLITDSELCPVATLADHLLVVREAEVRAFRSLNATLCLAQTLCVALGYRTQNTDE
ncbi:MAG: MurR/RpiR family transcriptional regulator [Thiolinea sp.]